MKTDFVKSLFLCSFLALFTACNLAGPPPEPPPRPGEQPEDGTTGQTAESELETESEVAEIDFPTPIPSNANVLPAAEKLEGASGETETEAGTAEICDAQGPFAAYSDQVRVACDDSYAYIETDSGLPDHEIMRGITAWILRVPIPFSYTGRRAWTIPRQPQWLNNHIAAHSRGPVAFGINGVPIYHFDKRPDVDLGEGYLYDAKFDTVQQGELDHCGGHAGQGEDYHYHTAPVCLLDDHDVSQPIGYTLGGAAIFYGTGATDYYGEGRYNNINNLPSGPLTACNGYQQADGSYIYYTTNTPPYVVGCYHEAIDLSLQVEPRVMRDLDQFGRNAVEIVSFIIEADGETRVLTFRTDQGELSAIVYRPSDNGTDCWEFDFRTDVSQSGTIETHCRVEQ